LALASVIARGWHAAVIVIAAMSGATFASHAFAAVCPMPEVGAQDGGQVSTAGGVRDRIEISRDDDRLVVDVCRARGIGDIEVSVPENGWPPAIVVRLHGFSELESFSAASRAGKLECALSRPEGQPPTQTCWVGSVRADVLQRGPDGFEVELPRALLAPDGGPVAVRWVDQWR
jgi:hypothetical protein